MKTFAELFKKYRLRAEFDTFSAFGDSLSEKGYFYEESIFSHWQKGTRTPTDRKLVLAMIGIFVHRQAIKTKDEADKFLESTGLGYITESEEKIFNFVERESPPAPFQVPQEIDNFTGRVEIVAKIQKEVAYGKTFLLHGSPGVGKTALAIKLGHLLKDKFPDGVLWYKVDSSNVMDILLSIARIFSEDIGGIKDIEVRASAVRTLLADKKVLLIFDNVTSWDKLYLLLPNTSSCCVIFTSQEKSLNVHSPFVSIEVPIFTKDETEKLFSKVFDKKYVAKNNKYILEIAKKYGSLPLAIQLAASQIKKFDFSAKEYLKQLEQEPINLEHLRYEDKNLYRAIGIGFIRLSDLEKKIFISLGVFEGKDFSLDAVAYINKISARQAEQVLLHLLQISFVEKASSSRYRIHSSMKAYAREQLTDPSLYFQAAIYYENLLNDAQNKRSYKAMVNDVDNIIYIFKKCYDAGYWDQVITLWNPLEKFLSDVNEIKKLRALTKTIDTAPNINKLQKIFTAYFVFLFFYWLILQFSGLKTSFWNYFYNIYTFIPFFGGLVGMVRSRSWGLKSNIGKAVFFISLGLFSWGSGNFIWTYYNFFQNVDVPYPSWADAGFFPAYILWIVGIIYLSRATGAKFNLEKTRSKFFLLIAPFLIAAASYYFLFFIVKREFASQTLIRIFADLYYPSMDIIILALSTIIFGKSVNFFGGKYKRSLFLILSGFMVLFAVDFLFSYTTSLNIYFNGGPIDIVFVLAHYLISMGTLSFYLTPKKNVV